jgi:hypothetical protein
MLVNSEQLIPERILEAAENKRKGQATLSFWVLDASSVKSGSGTPWLIRYSDVLESVE